MERKAGGEKKTSLLGRYQYFAIAMRRDAQEAAEGPAGIGT